MIRFARRRYLIRSVAALSAARSARPARPGRGPPRRPADRLRPPSACCTDRGPGPCTPNAPWAGRGLMDGQTRLTGSGSTPPLLLPSRSVTRMVRSATRCHHDPLNRALELHRAGTAPDVFQTDDLRHADLIRRRLAHRLDGWVKQTPHFDDFVRPALLAGQTEGVQWGLPLFSRVYTLYFNQHVLRAAGIGQPPHDLG